MDASSSTSSGNHVAALVAQFIGASYTAQGLNSIRHRRNKLKALLSNRALPPEPFSIDEIQSLLADVAAMDSNNFSRRIGVGEREGRILCPLVHSRHFGLAHGIGRSGDVAAVQPKAAGSSLLSQITNKLVLDAIKVAGATRVDATTVLPMATGMGMTMTLMAVARRRREQTDTGVQPKHCVWLRVDQKTCLKAITAADLVPVVVELRQEGDQLQGHVDDVAAAVDAVPGGADGVACVVSTTSCFAPRGADDVVAIGKLCARLGIPHVVNHAYGIQSRRLNAALDTAWVRGARIDACVSSTDKNFGVPVGGCVIFESIKSTRALLDGHQQGRGGGGGGGGGGGRRRRGGKKKGGGNAAVETDTMTPEAAAPAPAASIAPNPAPSRPATQPVTQLVNSQYPGRACFAPALDVLITLLYLGRDGWTKLLDDREACFDVLRDSLLSLADRTAAEPAVRTLRVLDSPGNPISIGVGIGDMPTPAEKPRPVTFLGSMLYQRGVTGARVVARGATAKVAGLSFTGYGSSTDAYGTDYLTAAAAVGGTREECVSFCDRVCQVLREE